MTGNCAKIPFMCLTCFKLLLNIISIRRPGKKFGMYRIRITIFMV